MAKRKGLGRGLGALIPTEAPAGKEPKTATKTSEIEGNSSGLRSVKVNTITPNPKQPRSTFVEEKLQELADSIKEHGLIQPLIVSEYKKGNYHLIAGERRWRASQRAGLEEVLVVVREASPQEMLELAIIENVQRDDLNAVEEAMAYQQLMDEFNLTQLEVSKKMGKARSTVANLLRLIELPASVQQAVVDGKITGRHAREMLRLESANDMKAVLDSIINLDLNVRQESDLIDLILKNPFLTVKNAALDGKISYQHAHEILRLESEEDMRLLLTSIINLDMNLNQTIDHVDKKLAGKKNAPREQKRLPAELNAAQEKFRQHLGMKVDIAGNNKKGKIVIHYDSGEDLNTIYEHFINE